MNVQCVRLKKPQTHVDLLLECWLVVSDLNGKEIGWTFSEHLTDVKFHDIRSELIVLVRAYIERCLLTLQIVSNTITSIG
jgi:hypothetical protein